MVWVVCFAPMLAAAICRRLPAAGVKPTFSTNRAPRVSLRPRVKFHVIVSHPA